MHGGLLPSGVLHIDSAGGIDEYRWESNGLRVLLYPQAGTKVAALMVTYHVGSRNEPTGLTGATHFLEHLMFKGTERFNWADGNSVFQTLQAVGAQVNASTWLDRTNYYAVLPCEYLKLAVEIEADRMRHALISDRDVESERSVILNELDRGENEPLRKLYQMVWSSAFLVHPYRHPTIGWRYEVERLSVEALRGFYDTFYWPNNATVSVIGGFDPGSVLAMLNDHFGQVPAAPDEIYQGVTEEPRQIGKRHLEVQKAGDLGAVMIAFKSPNGLDPKADALDLLARTVGSGRGSRLHLALTDKGLATSASATVSRLRDPGLFVTYAMLSPEVSHQRVETVIREELTKIADSGIRKDEQSRALAMIRAQEAFGRDGPFDIATRLNEAVATGDWKLYAEYVSRIERVNTADVQDAAASFLQSDQSTSGWYIPV